MSQPNILFIMSDDHASHAISCYGSVINRTPNIDRIATGGMRLDNCLCSNSICAPSRATILTGTYSHVNGVTTLATHFDNSQDHVGKQLQNAGYQTALFGKWHLGQGPEHWPTGFDRWNILPGQGLYHDPEMIDQGTRVQRQGYTTDLVTDDALDWLEGRDESQPFCLFVHHKAPHRPWEPDARHSHLYDDREMLYPATFDDDFERRSRAAQVARMTIDHDMTARDIKVQPLRNDTGDTDALEFPEDINGFTLHDADGAAVTFESHEHKKRWIYQRYIKDYLRCVASVDDNVGRLLDRLDESGLSDDTIVVYTSDQGFFLGDHGWFDKRFMYEESLRMPFLIRYPAAIPAGTSTDAMVLNSDFAPTFLDYAGVPIPSRMQGTSCRAVLGGSTPPDWRRSMYYRYWMHGDSSHNTCAHYGLRTHRYKLIYYYADGLGLPGTFVSDAPREWELFDLWRDPFELHNRYHDPDYAEVVTELTDELGAQQIAVGDQPYGSTR